MRCPNPVCREILVVDAPPPPPEAPCAESTPPRVPSPLSGSVGQVVPILSAEQAGLAHVPEVPAPSRRQHPPSARIVLGESPPPVPEPPSPVEPPPPVLSPWHQDPPGWRLPAISGQPIPEGAEPELPMAEMDEASTAPPPTETPDWRAAPPPPRQPPPSASQSKTPWAEPPAASNSPAPTKP